MDGGDKPGHEGLALAMTDTDPFLWLEEVEGDKALDWVRAQNARSLAEIEADPRYQGFNDATLKIITAEDRIPYVSFRGANLSNFWQDQTHVRGLWRQTVMESYRTAEPNWRTILDIDALAAAEGKNWVFQGAGGLLPTTAITSSVFPMAARTPRSGASSMPPSGNLSGVGSPCPRASRAPPGSTPIRCWSHATGGRGR